MEDKVTKLRKEVYDIPTPSSLTIGDGSYLEEIASQPKNKTKRLRDLVFMDGSIPAVRKAKIVFNEVLIESDAGKVLFPDGMRQYEVRIIVSNKEYIDTFVNDMFYPKAEKSRHELGCDIASFDIIAGYKDGVREDTIDTGADGFYGDVLINQVPFGFIVNLYLDADYVSESRLKASLAYLFKCEELGKYGSTVCQVTLSSKGQTCNARLQIPYKTALETVKEILQSECRDAHVEPDKLLDKVCRRYGWKWIKADPAPDTQGVVLDLN